MYDHRTVKDGAGSESASVWLQSLSLWHMESEQAQLEGVGLRTRSLIPRVETSEASLARSTVD